MSKCSDTTVGIGMCAAGQGLEPSLPSGGLLTGKGEEVRQRRHNSGENNQLGKYIRLKASELLPRLEIQSEGSQAARYLPCTWLSTSVLGHETAARVSVPLLHDHSL